MTATVIDLAQRRNGAERSHFCDPAKKNGCGTTDPAAFAPNEHSRCRDCRKADKKAWHAAHGRVAAAPKATPAPVAEVAPAEVPTVPAPSPVAETPTRAPLTLTVGEPSETSAFSEPVTFDGTELASALRAAVITASTDEERPVLCGVLFDFTEGHVNLVSTDSYRMGIVPVDYSGTAPAGAVIVDARALEVFASLAVGAEVTVAFSESHAVFATEGLRYVVRLTEGRYPNYRRILPAVGAGLTLDAPALRGALAGAAGDKAVGLAIDGDTLRVGAAKALTCGNPGVEAMTWAGDPAFIADGLAYVGSDSVEFQVTDPKKAAVIRGGGRQYIVMPFITKAAA